jgi:DNA polymerase III delta subunit
MAERKPKEASPGEQVAAFEKSVATGALPRGVVVRGDERWFRERAIRAALDAAKRAHMEIARHDAQDPDFNVRHLTDDLLAAPMFAASRCILVRNASPLLKKDDGEDSTVARAVMAFLKDTASAGAIVIDAEGLRADHTVVKLVVSKGGPVLSLRRLYDAPPPWDPDPRKSEVVQWLVALARERKVPLGADDAVYVAAATGNDLFALEAALERLAQRGSQHLREIIGWSSGGSPFELAEHLVRGDGPRSIAGIELLFRHGFVEKSGGREVDRNALLAITLGMLRSKLRQAVAGADVLQKKGDIAAAAAAAGVPAFPQARTEFELRLRARDPRAWPAMQDDLAALERRTRTGALIDAADLAALALRWRVREKQRAR